jgi:predicted alpha/beta hydrolase family esterase
MTGAASTRPHAPPVLIVPGWTGSGPAHWQTRWERANPAYRRVEQADWDAPDVAAWVAVLDGAVRAAPAPPVLVAHSLGCIAVAHWAAAGTPGRAAGALLVAPADVERPAAPAPIRCFAPIPRRPLPFPTVVVASRDDPYVAFDRAAALATAWGADLVDAGAAGHLNSDAGFGPWPAGEALLAGLLQRVARRGA